MYFTTSSERRVLTLVLHTLGAAQQSQDLQVAHDATEFEIQMRRAFGLPMTREIPLPPSVESRKRGGRV